jgi:hypothetical protein
MSYVPNFENDVFISYAHIDNQPLTDTEKGWIDEFHRALEIRLQELLGDRPKIWRDPKLQGNDVFGDTLVEQFSQAALLVSVFSPRYVKSEWCLRELTEFMKIAERRQGLVIGNKARIFKVLKTLVELDRQPPPVQGMLGYEFYEIDKATGRPKEFRHEFGEDAVKRFWARLDDLAWDIRQLLDALRSPNGGNGKPQLAPSGPAIYLAETTFDLTDERDRIKRELQHLGYAIFPDKPLPLIAGEFQNAVRSHLSQCKLSVHLIGENYGIIPEGEFFSVVHLQNELASERSRNDASFSRLIWIPVGLATRDPRQDEFVAFLQNDSEAQKGADVLRVPLEDLKTVIQDKLTAKKKPAPEVVTAAGPLRIYLIYEQNDFDAIAPLEGFLFDQGFEVLPPIFEEDEAAVREAHNDNLKLCDAAIIYYGQGSESWVRAKLRDLMKAPGLGREKPMLAKLVYIDAPPTPQKQRFRTNEAMVIAAADKFSPETLAPFLDVIKSGAK